MPKVAIVGRPNVGKSTLYNRLLKDRKSITDPTPGVTRDPVRSLWSLFGSSVVLIDTGGLTESKEFLDAHITKKSLAAAEEAQVLVFVVDVDGLTPEDEEFVQRLRKLSDRLILVVNKVDNQKRTAMVADFYSLGFEPIIPVSAAHGDGVGDLLDEIAKKLGIVSRLGHTGVIRNRRPSRQRETEDPDLEDQDFVIDINEAEGTEEFGGNSRVRTENPWDISMAILGQPNTGKSTLTNLLSGSDISLVSPIAGTTRDVIEGSFRYKEKHFRILDTAGIRRKAKVHEDLEYYSVNRAIASVEEADVVLLLIDAEKGLSEQDKKIAAQIVKLGRGVILVVNKWDLMETSGTTIVKVRDRMRFQFPILAFAPIMAISAMNGRGVPDLLDEALKVQAQLLTRLETSHLNNLLKEWIDSTPPPTTKGATRWKCRYITQASTHPLRFVLFVNKASGFPEGYINYLTNQLRNECNLDKVPLRMILRESAKR